MLLAAHHGDKAKANRLVLNLADRWPEMWGRTRHRFLFTGHLHHHKSEDIGGVQWEQLRALTAKVDAYAISHAYSARAQLQGSKIVPQGGRGIPYLCQRLARSSSACPPSRASWSVTLTRICSSATTRSPDAFAPALARPGFMVYELNGCWVITETKGLGVREVHWCCRTANVKTLRHILGYIFETTGALTLCGVTPESSPYAPRARHQPGGRTEPRDGSLCVAKRQGSSPIMYVKKSA